MKPLGALGFAAVWAFLGLPPGAYATDSVWQKIANPPPVTGADGRPHAATCSGFPGTDPTFSFWARHGTSNNLVVFFEGGGACWDGITCSDPIAPGLPPDVPQLFMPAIPPDTDPAALDGIFNTANPANPVKDWSAVYIPYCTGDLHAGSITNPYTSLGNAALQIPPGYRFSIQHKGFDNFMVVLDWMQQNMGAPGKVLVTGVSAGGYGASVNFPWIAQSYPGAALYVIADASQGVSPPSWDRSPKGRGNWNLQLAPWVFGTHPALVRGGDLLGVAARAYPQAQVAQFTTAQDAVQTAFYGVQRSEGYPSAGTCPANTAADWNELMLGTLQVYAGAVPNYRHYVADGSYHTIMESAAFYTENSAGTTFSAWVSGMLGGPGAPWVDAACPSCAVPLPCQ